MLDEPSNINLKKILCATEEYRRTHDYDLNDLLKVFNIKRNSIRFTTIEVHAFLSGGDAPLDVRSDTTLLTLPQAGIWDVLRVAIDLCSSRFESRPFCVVKECLESMLDSSLPQDLQGFWFNIAEPTSIERVFSEELTDYYATIAPHDNKAALEHKDLFSHILFNFKEYQANYHYRLAKSVLVDFIGQSGDVLSFLDSSAQTIETKFVRFIEYVPRFAGAKVEHDDHFLCSSGWGFPEKSAMTRLVRILLLGAIGSEYVYHHVTSEEDLEDRINEMQDMTLRPTSLDSKSFWIDGYQGQFQAEAFVAQFESCIQDLVMAGTWNFAQGSGEYPVYWNTDAINVLTFRDSTYARYLLGLAHEEDEKNQRAGRPYFERQSRKPAEAAEDDWGADIPANSHQQVAESEEHKVGESWNDDLTQPEPSWPHEFPDAEKAWEGSNTFDLIWDNDPTMTKEAAQPRDTWFDHAATEPESINDNTAVANLIWQNSPPGFIEDVDSPQPFLSWDNEVHGRANANSDDWFIDWNDVFVDELPTFANKNNTYADSAIGDLDWGDDHTAVPATSGQWDDDAEKTVDWNDVNSSRPEVYFYYSGTFSAYRETYSDDYADWNGVTSLGPNDYSHVLNLSKHVDVDDHVDWNAVTSIGPDSYFPGSFAVFKKDNDEVSLVWENDPAAELAPWETGVALDDFILSFHDWNGVNSENPRSYGELMANDNNGSDLGDPQDHEDSQAVMDWGVDTGHGLSWDAPAVDDNNNFEESLISVPTMDWGQDDVQTMPALWEDDNAQDVYWGSDAGNNVSTFTEWSTNQTSNWNDDAHQQAGSWGDGNPQGLSWDNPADQDKHTSTEWVSHQISDWNDYSAQQPISWGNDATQDFLWDAPAGDEVNTYSEWDRHQVSNWDDDAAQDLLWGNPAVNDDDTVEDTITDHSLDWGSHPSHMWSDKKSWPEDVAELFATGHNDAFEETSFDWDQDATYRTAARDGKVTKYVTWDDDRNLSWENNNASQCLDWDDQEIVQNLSWNSNEDKQELDWGNDDGVQKASWENDETAQNDLWETNDTPQGVSCNNDDAQVGAWDNNESKHTLTWQDYEAAQELSWANNHHTQNVSWNDNNDDAHFGTWDDNIVAQNGSWNNNEAAQSLTWEKYEAAQQLLWDNNDSNHNLTRNEHALSAWNNDNATVFQGDSALNYTADNDDSDGDVNDDDYNADMSFHARPSKSHKSVAWSNNIANIQEPKSYFWNDNTEASPRSDRSEHEISESAHEQHDYWGRGSAWTAGERSPSEW